MCKKFISFILIFCIVLCLFGLTACGKSNYGKTLTGSWYLAEDSTPMFTLYEDHTCEIDNEYGAGTWDIVDDDQLKLTNFYGENTICTIVELKGDKLTLLVNGSLYILYNTAMHEREKAANINNVQNINDFIVENISANGFGFHHKDAQNTEDNFWVHAKDYNNYSYYIALDKDFNIITLLSAEEFIPVTVFYQDIAVVENRADGKNILIDRAGNNVTAQYFDEETNPVILGIWRDNTGVNLWSVCETDTYNSHETKLQHKNIDTSQDFYWADENLELSILQECKYEGNNIYSFKKSGTGTSGYIVTLDDGVLHTGYESSSYLNGTDYNGAMCFKNNNNIWKQTEFGTDDWRVSIQHSTIGRYMEGFIYVGGETYIENEFGSLEKVSVNGFLNNKGELAIELDMRLDQYCTPYFLGDYAEIECVNDNYVHFVTLIDKSGNIMFDPIRGECFRGTFGTSEHPLYLMRDKDSSDNHFYLTLDGVKHEIPSLTNTDKMIVVDNQCIYIDDNGQLLSFTF